MRQTPALARPRRRRRAAGDRLERAGPARRRQRPQSAAPSAPPAAASTLLSISNSRTSELRVAPRAVRTANSPRRSAPRASRRFATFAQPMRSRTATAPRSNWSTGRDRFESASPSGSTVAPSMRAFRMAVFAGAKRRQCIDFRARDFESFVHRPAGRS